MATDKKPRKLLTPGEVAMRFRVDSKTVHRWADNGRLSYLTTLGGHLRFFEDQVEKLLAQEPPPAKKRRRR